MAVHVKFHPLLVKRAKSRHDVMDVPYRAGLRPLDIILDEGFREADAEAIMVLVNDAQVDADAALKDGDRVELMVGIQGG